MVTAFQKIRTGHKMNMVQMSYHILLLLHPACACTRNTDIPRQIFENKISTSNDSIFLL